MADDNIARLEEEVKRLKARVDTLVKKYQDHSHALNPGQDEDSGLTTLEVGYIYEEDEPEPEEKKERK